MKQSPHNLVQFARVDTRRHPTSRQGFTLVEILVAGTIFAIVSTALTQTLATAMHARRSSQRWLTATALAMERLEMIRTADRGGDDTPGQAFESVVQLRPVPGYPALGLAEVVVSWQDQGRRSFTLTAYVPIRE